MTPSPLHLLAAEHERLFGRHAHISIIAHFEKLTACHVPSPDKPEETPEAVIRALYLTASGRPVSATRAISTPLQELDDHGRRKLASLIAQRCEGVPLAHLTGRQSFMDIEMLAGPYALIPRSETQLLAREVVRLARLQSAGSARVIDVCTGSGNIALAVALRAPGSEVFASDISADAISFAHENARHVGAENKVRFSVGDLLEPFSGQEFLRSVDIISCNPPYISTQRLPKLAAEIQQYEPHAAFDGGPFGLTIVSRVIREAPALLKPAGSLCLEVGAGQGPFVARLFEKSGLYRDAPSAITDESGEVRVLVARAR